MKESAIWVLCEGDIEFCCRKMGVSFYWLTEEQKENIAHYFKKGFEFGCESWWQECLEDAIREVCRLKGEGDVA